MSYLGVPLIGVLMLTAIKDAYDDYQRHVSDSQVNNRISKALRNGKLVDEKWSGVQVKIVLLLNFNYSLDYSEKLDFVGGFFYCDGGTEALFV